jgi:hypothetical protein
MKTTRTVEIKNIRLKVAIRHAHFQDGDKIGGIGDHDEILLLSLSLTYPSDGACGDNLDGLFSYAGWHRQVEQLDGSVLNTPLETLLDKAEAWLVAELERQSICCIGYTLSVDRPALLDNGALTISKTVLHQ